MVDDPLVILLMFGFASMAIIAVVGLALIFRQARRFRKSHEP